MSDAKPRRFWLDICTPYGDPCDFISEGEPPSLVSSTNIEVIEASAYDALEARIAELEIVLTTIVNRYDEAKAENPNASHLMCGSTAGVANLAREVLAKKEGT